MRSRLAEWLLVPFLLLPVAIGAALWLYAERQWRAEIEPYLRDGEGTAIEWLADRPGEAARAREAFLLGFGPGGEARPEEAQLVPFDGPAGDGEVLLGEHALGRDPWTLAADLPGGLSAAALADPTVRLEIEKGAAPATLEGVDAATVAFRDLAAGPDLDRLRTAPLPATTKRFLVRRWIAAGAEDPRLPDAQRLLAALTALDRASFDAFANLSPGDHPAGAATLIASGGAWPVLLLPKGRRSIAGTGRWVADLGRVRLRYSSPLPAIGSDSVWTGRLEQPVAGEWTWVEWWHHMGEWPVVSRWAGPAVAVLAALFLLPLALLVSLRKRRKLDEARSRFINELAHDLRTPLTSLRLYAEMLAEGRAPEDEKERYVSVLARESARLSTLLGNLLDLSRLERGAREFTPERLEMDEAAETAIRDFVMLYPDRADDLKVSGPDDIAVRADRTALSRCLANLLDNAGKFTEAGTPLRVSWRRGDRGRVLLVVADEGPGIPEPEERRLFARYARGSRAKKDGVPGSGSGSPSSASSWTAWTGGCACCRPTAAPRSSSTSRRGPMTERRILVVEDDRTIREGLTDALRSEGYEVLVAPDGDTGLRLGLTEDPDLVVLDLMLPGLDGFDVLERLRKDGVETPILVLTARGLEEDKVRGLDLGADDYVVKPFGLSELLARIRSRLRAWDRERGFEGLSRIRFGAVSVDFAARAAERTPLALTPKELDLLEFLASREGRAVSRLEILEAVWGEDDVVSRVVDTAILGLRKKIEPDPASPTHVRSVRGVGYRFTRR